ncbi:hypothetical protein CEXT_289101 [Caerostris extrusa]|uniref:Uncharacterized protein n=1 Tax=Caerostris extrusa TaxID=172846 RepID=A0AAV4QZN9_CAEEX|nr:hypothetical protein CEXT_289101 [Caerostris extrusa]
MCMVQLGPKFTPVPFKLISQQSSRRTQLVMSVNINQNQEHYNFSKERGMNGDSVKKTLFANKNLFLKDDDETQKWSFLSLPARTIRFGLSQSGDKTCSTILKNDSYHFEYAKLLGTYNIAL